MKTPDQDDFERFMRERGHTVIGGFRKRQIENLKPKTADEFYAEMRNMVLEEVALEFDQMRFGDTSSSFAAFVRGMKK